MLEFILMAVFLWRIGDVAHSKGRGRWRYRLIGLLVLVPAWLLGSFVREVIMSNANNAESTPGVMILISGIICVYGSIILAGILFWKKVNSIAALEGAPGESYLFISFYCPECKSPIRFRRDYAGTLVRCPKCNKHTMVPEQSQITEALEQASTVNDAQHAPPGGRGEAPRPCGWSWKQKR